LAKEILHILLVTIMQLCGFATCSLSSERVALSTWQDAIG